MERGFPTCRDKGEKVMTRSVGGIRKCPTCEPIVNAKILQYVCEIYAMYRFWVAKQFEGRPEEERG